MPSLLPPATARGSVLSGLILVEGICVWLPL